MAFHYLPRDRGLQSKRYHPKTVPPRRMGSPEVKSKENNLKGNENLILNRKQPIDIYSCSKTGEKCEPYNMQTYLLKNKCNK